MMFTIFSPHQNNCTVHRLVIKNLGTATESELSHVTCIGKAEMS